jgi:predicted dehydrogenase
MGWWSDVLADAVGRSSAIEIVTCYTRSEEKRAAFAAKYRCRAAESYEEILADDSVQAVINTTPNSVHLETVRAAAEAGKHIFLDKPIANSIADGEAITEICATEGVILSIGYQRRRESHYVWIKEQIDAGYFGKLVQAECNISRDRLGKIDLSSWRYQSTGMPGGVMLQIGIHYTDVLEMLMGPVKRVSAMSARLVLSGDNPDVANMVLEHENGSISNLTASYASASEYYMMNVYGKEASAYYDLFGGLRYLKRGDTEPTIVPCERIDSIVGELEEFAACVRGEATPEVGGQRATESLAVIRAGAKSVKEGRVVDVAEILNSPDE